MYAVLIKGKEVVSNRGFIRSIPLLVWLTNLAKRLYKIRKLNF